MMLTLFSQFNLATVNCPQEEATNITPWKTTHVMLVFSISVTLIIMSQCISSAGYVDAKGTRQGGEEEGWREQRKPASLISQMFILPSHISA